MPFQAGLNRFQASDLSVESIYHCAREANDLCISTLATGKISLMRRLSLTGLKSRLPLRFRMWLKRCRGAARRSSVVFNRVTDWSVLRRLQPYRPDFGFHYGKCIDRYYIERFLAAHKDSIRGHVVEIGSDDYIKLFGDARVEESDVLDIDEHNEKRTLTLDLAQPASAPENVFDCVLCIQTLFEIYNHAAALISLHKMLKPGGVLLASLPGISQRVRGRMLGGGGTDWWRYTTHSATRMFADVFGESNVEVCTYGNVLTATAFLHGLVATELTRAELEYNDPDYEVTIGVKATKPKPR